MEISGNSLLLRILVGLVLVLELHVLPSQAYVRPGARNLISVDSKSKSSKHEPQQVHVSMVGEEHMKVSWVTESFLPHSTVEYGREPGKYVATAVGDHLHYQYVFYISGKIHHTTIGPLKPATTYYYRCGGAGSEFSFRTPPSSLPVEFVVVGDLGQTEWTKSTLDHIAQKDYDIFLLPGDLSYADTQQPLWDSFGRLVEPYASARPWMTTEGNHEIETIPILHSQSFTSYNSRWAMPYKESASTSNLYYSFDVASGAIHVIMLGSYTDYDVDSDQYKWLKDDLARVDRARTPWLFVALHAPWYNSNAAHKGEGEGMRLAMEALLYNARVDVVFAGHVHAYERFTRVYNNVADPCGPVYITIGDGGNREGLAMTGDIDSINILKNTLNHFGLYSGLHINVNKSSIFLGGVDQHDHDSIASSTGIPIGSLPFTYLGIPIGSRRLRIADFAMLINNITHKINAWSARKLSYAGRKQLISSILVPLQYFWCSLLPIPHKIILKINGLLRSFLWSGSDSSRRSLVAWSTVCSPKADGGLDFKELLAWNKACISKMIFELHNNHSSFNLWTSWISNNVLKQRSIWNCEANYKYSSSWNYLIKIKDLIRHIQCTRPGSDFISSVVKANGKFSITLAYNFIHQLPPPANPTLYNNIWRRTNIPKGCFIAWIAAHNRLPTRTKLLAWNLTQHDTCYLCERNPENESHLFHDCSFATITLNLVSRWMHVPPPFPYSANLWNWLGSLNSQSHKHCLISMVRIAAIINFIYFIWRARNDTAFNNKTTSEVTCAHNIIQATKNHFSHHWKDRSNQSTTWAATLGIQLM